MAMDNKNAEFMVKVTQTDRGGVNIALDYSHANFPGSMGTYTLNQSIDLLDNGLRIGGGSFSIPIFAITNNVVLKCPGKNIDMQPKIDFKLENTDRLFSMT